MRTKAFEDMLKAKTEQHSHNPINAIERTIGISTIQKKKKVSKNHSYSASVTQTSFGDKQFVAVEQFEVMLMDEMLLMTVGWDGEELTFHYFGITADESSDDCLLKKYELGIVMRALHK